MSDGIDLSVSPIRITPLKVASPTFPVGSYTAGSVWMEQAPAIMRGTEDARARLFAYVLARQLVGDQQLLEVCHPSTWWQHLKQSLPGWVQRRWPVRYCTTRARVSFAKYDTYPEASVMPAEYGKPVQVDTISWKGPDGPWGAPCDGSHTASVRSTPVNPGREFLGRDEMTSELAMLVAAGSSRNRVTATHEVISVLERLGVNTGQLVQRHAIDDAHRTW